METILNQVEAFARHAHGTQRRKFADEMYIEHPIRVMKLCKEVTGSVPILAAALLHDVLEDTPVTGDDLRDVLSGIMDAATTQETMKLVIGLTDIYTHEAYPQWNRRTRKEKEVARMVSTSSDTHTIKYADIIDNAKDIIGSGSDFSLKFLHECKNLLRKIPNGNAVLYQRAKEAVDQYLGEIGSGKKSSQSL